MGRMSWQDELERLAAMGGQNRTAEQETMNRGARQATESANRLTTLVDVISNNIEASATYKSGTDKFHKYYTGKNGESISYTGKMHGALSGYTRSIERDMQRMTDQTDAARGKYELQRYARLVGLGSVSRTAARKTVAASYYRGADNKDLIAVQKALSEDKQAKFQTTDFHFDTTHAKISTDFRADLSNVNRYLDGYGINPNQLRNKDIDKLLKKEDIKDNKHLTAVLKEKKRLNNFQEKYHAAERMPGGLKNTANAWMGEVLKDSDAGQGLKYYNGIIKAGKAMGTLGRASVHGAAHVAVTTAGLTGRAAASATGQVAQLQANKALKIGDKAKATQLQTLSNKAKATSDKIRTAQDKIVAMNARGARSTLGQKITAVSKNLAKATPPGKAYTQAKEAGRKTLNAMKTSLKNSKLGKIAGKVNIARNKVAKIGAVVFAPLNFIRIIKQKIQIIAIGFVVIYMLLCMFVVAPLMPTIKSYDPEFVEAKENGEPTTAQLMIEAIQAEYLKCVTGEAFGKGNDWDIICDGYEGTASDEYEFIASPGDPSSSYVDSEGMSHPYEYRTVIKAIFAMACAKFYGETDDALYKDSVNEDAVLAFCRETTRSMLAQVETVSEESPSSGVDENGTPYATRGTYTFKFTACGLVDGMRLDGDQDEDKDIDWSEMKHSVAQEIFEWSDSDWEELGIDFEFDFPEGAMSELEGGVSGENATGEVLSDERIKEIIAAIEGVEEGSKAYSLLYSALTMVGGKYTWGGSGFRSADCSGSVLWSYKQIGFDIGMAGGSGRRSHMMYDWLCQQGMGVEVNGIADLRPGDVVFEDHNGDGTIDHVYTYIGNGYKMNGTGTESGIEYKPVGKGKVMVARILTEEDFKNPNAVVDPPPEEPPVEPAPTEPAGMEEEDTTESGGTTYFNPTGSGTGQAQVGIGDDYDFEKAWAEYQKARDEADKEEED